LLNIRSTLITSNSQLEKNLNANAITPKIHRTDLLKVVHRPKFYTKNYIANPIDENTILPSSLEFLKRLTAQTELSDHSLQQKVGKQLKKFYRKACHIYEELGVWASGYFIWETINILKSSFSDDLVTSDLRDYLLQRLSQPSLENAHKAGTVPQSTGMSEKLRLLIDFLDDRNPESSTGLIFVEQRVTVGVIRFILSIHPQTKDRFRCGSFVGTAGNAYKKYSMSELFDLKTQKESLNEFRAGLKNIIVATDVLEEGIDVSACNLVVCFSPPKNLKSFIQRRGRARDARSEFAIFTPADKAGSIDRWLSAEMKLIEEYQKEVEDRTSMESDEGDDEETMDYVLEVKSTG
jgi:Lhr-like helicase